MSAAVLVLAALAGGLGAAARYTLDYAIMQRIGGGFPWGTWAVNMTGSLGLGLLVGAAARFELSTDLVILVGGGFLGAYTTFSTWMYETLRLLEQGAWRLAAANIVGSLVPGAGAAAAGIWIGAAM